MKIPFWLSRAVIYGYPVFISALALLRLSQGQYETGLYMATTALLFLLNTRLAALNSALIAANRRAVQMMEAVVISYEFMRANLDAALARAASGVGR